MPRWVGAESRCAVSVIASRGAALPSPSCNVLDLDGGAVKPAHDADDHQDASDPRDREYEPGYCKHEREHKLPHHSVSIYFVLAPRSRRSVAGARPNAASWRRCVKRTQRRVAGRFAEEKGSLRATLALRAHVIHRSTRVPRVVIPGLSATYAGRAPVVYEHFSGLHVPEQLPTRAGSGCLSGVVFFYAGKSLAIGTIVSARDVILDYVSPIAPRGRASEHSAPPLCASTWGGDNKS